MPSKSAGQITFSPVWRQHDHKYDRPDSRLFLPTRTRVKVHGKEDRYKVRFIRMGDNHYTLDISHRVDAA